ncbi:MAG: hypothetical protein HYX84_08485 [Chloroflexi bacterium]|nr:hypothetical protein [Chloroflexota bacterium]
MTDKAEQDRQLLQNLDRILAGKESEITGPLDDDTQSALDFAGKMVSLHEKPSKEFAAGLKAELVHRLAEQDRKKHSRDEPFLLWGIEIQHRTMWQGTVAAAIVVIITVIILLITLLLNRGG